MLVVINRKYGGFSLSPLAALYIDEQAPGILGRNFENRLIKGAGRLGDYYENHSLAFRSNPVLVNTVAQLGELADGELAALKIIEIPDDVEVEITDHDGIEAIEEKHRIWR